MNALAMVLAINLIATSAVAQERPNHCAQDSDCLAINSYQPPEGTRPGMTLISCVHKDAKIDGKTQWKADVKEGYCICKEHQCRVP